MNKRRIYYNNGNEMTVTYEELERLSKTGHINKYNVYKIEIIEEE